MMKRDFGRSLIAVTVATLGSTTVILGASRPSVVATQADASGTLGIRIRLRIERTIPIRRLAPQVKDETTAIWRPYGIQLEWVDADTVEPRATGVSLDVTVERRDGRAGRIEWASTLGRTVVGPDTRGWHPIRVSFDPVANVLADGTTSRVSGAGLVPELYLTRALGRVLAHEIGHVLTNAAEHDRTGLMRAKFSAGQLAQPDRSPFRLTCATVDRLSDRLHIVGGASSIAQLDAHVCIR
jgi:hypothetical protein